MPQAQNKTYSVLLVDDSEDDRLFMRRALARNPRFDVVAEVCDGEVAIEYLGGQGVYGDREKHPFPNLVLLDLKMPRKTGHEVLQWLRTHKIGHLCVVVVSGSFLPEDVARSMVLGAAAYYKKNALKEELAAMIHAIEDLLDKSHDRPHH